MSNQEPRTKETTSETEDVFGISTKDNPEYHKDVAEQESGRKVKREGLIIGVGLIGCAALGAAIAWAFFELVFPVLVG